MVTKLNQKAKKLNELIEHTPFSEHSKIKKLYWLSLETLECCYLHYRNKVNGDYIISYPEEIKRLIHNTKILAINLNGVEFPEYLCEQNQIEDTNEEENQKH